MSDHWNGGRTFTNKSGSNGRYNRNSEGWNGEKRETRETRLIRVPSRFVGKIIGKQGATIKDLEFKSASRIIVTKDTSEEDTFIKIIGGDLSTAENLIRELTVERERYQKLSPPRQEWTEREKTPEPEPAPETPPKPEEPFDWYTSFKQSQVETAQYWANLPPTQKVFYEEHPDVTALTEEEVAEIREENNKIVVKRVFSESDKPIPKPVQTFEQAFHNYPEILEMLKDAGFTKPSPIQCQAWPVLLGGEDMIGIAQTGTGKTLAFLLPALIHIDKQLTTREERTGPVCLVFAPTRELALQITEEAEKFQYRGINAVCIYGGSDRKQQIESVAKGVDIIVATPGRFDDLYMNNLIDCSYITYVVLDEADRMLDMGFEPQLNKVVPDLKPDKQVVMTTATWPSAVNYIAQKYTSNPIQVQVGSMDLTATHTVTQRVEFLDDDDYDLKQKMAIEFIRNVGPDEKAIIFCGMKGVARDLEGECYCQGIRHLDSIHGDKGQPERETAMKRIKNGSVRVLIATDVASRGLDIDDVTHVLNYDFPKHIEDYVHRIGRAGRAGKTGIAISYFTRSDWGNAEELIRILEEAGQPVPERLVEYANNYRQWKEKRAQRPTRGKFGNRGGRRW